jgi:hypothetical protein
MFNSAQGKEFVIAIPPNELEGYTANALEIYVTSQQDCQVTIYNAYTGLMIKKKVTANKITTFSSANGELNWNMECRESEVVLNHGISISADFPVSVHVLNAKLVSADGFLAVPVSSWGREYFHCSYYDFKEIQEWAGGFIVTASEDNTKVSISLYGRGKGSGKTSQGRDIGDVISVVLNQGQVYMVKGNGKSRGIWDLSGTKITSSKPVGLISFHERTMIPAFDIWNGRDHLSEMLLPTTSWGKSFITSQFKRDKNMGDYFRIMASQDSTHFTVKYYDPSNNKLAGTYSGTLKKPGDFLEFLEVFVPQDKINTIKSIWGVAVWEADKPVQLMQYAYSADWDSQTEFDPLMVLIPPTDQYANSTIFQTPASSAFITNWFKLIALHDTNDVNFNDLRSFKIDDKAVSQLDSSFVKHQVPGTNYYWSTYPLPPGSHSIYNDKVKFSGIMYGFSYQDSYAWPAAMLANNLYEIDTIAPKIVLLENKISAKFIAKDTIVENSSKPKKYRDQGIYHIWMIDSSTSNCILVYDKDILRTIPRTLNFEVKLIDQSKDGFAKFAVADRYGNTAYDSVYIKRPVISLNFSNKELDFGKVNLKSTKTLSTSFTNSNLTDIRINTIKLKNSYLFKTSIVSSDFILKPNDSYDVDITYKPIIENSDSLFFDKDTLIVTANGQTFFVAMKGKAIREIKLDFSSQELDFGKVILKTSKMLTASITNPNLTDTRIDSIKLKNSMLFKISNFPSDLILKPNDSYNVDITFTPIIEAQDSLFYDKDTLIVIASGNNFSLPMKGKGVKINAVEDELKTEFEISPNPVGDFLEISVGTNGPSPLQNDIRIYNVLGEIQTTVNPTPALPASREGVRIDVSGLAPGMYFVRIGEKVSKFVKL